MILKQMVDTFIIKDKKILLGMKNRGIGNGFWNGFGGKVEIGESIQDAAIREVKEESGLIVSDLHECARFIFTGELPVAIEAHTFVTNEFDGNVVPSDEMSPIEWHPISSLPFDCMWLNFQIWIHDVLSGSCSGGHAHYEGRRMTSHTIRTYDTLPKIEEILPLPVPRVYQYK